MALQSSGSISILELAAEFGFQSGQGNFRNLSDYYAGDGLVASSLTDTSGNTRQLYNFLQTYGSNKIFCLHLSNIL